MIVKVFFAATSKLAKIGGFRECLDWAEDRVANKEAKIVKILKARPEDVNAKIVGEVTSGGFSDTPGGRAIDLKRLQKHLNAK